MPAPPVPRRILVCRVDNLGDVMMAFPALRWLKAQHPGGLRIEMVVRDYARVLAERCPWVDRVWSPDEVAQAAHGGAPAPDAVFHLQSSRPLLRACAAWGIPLRVGNLLRSAHWLQCNRWVAFSKRRLREHESLIAWRYFAPVFGPPPDAARWQALLREGGWLARRPPDTTWPVPFLHSPGPRPLRVLLHPGSNGNGRQWPLAHFLRLAQALHAGGHAVAVTGSAAERAALKPLLDALPHGVDDLVGGHHLADFIPFIAQADCLVASGTGPLHIAGAGGVHAVGIFPPIVPLGALRWRPIGPRVSTLQTPSPGPCRRDCSNLDCACMAEVTPERVLQALLSPPDAAAGPQDRG